MAEPYDRWHKARPKPDDVLCEHGKAPTAEHGVHPRYQARYRDEHGKQQKPGFDKKKDAKDFLDKYYGDRQKGVFYDPKAGESTFEEYARDRIDKMYGLRERTRENYLRDLKNHVFNGPHKDREDPRLQALGIGRKKLRTLRKRGTFEDLFGALELGARTKQGIWDLVNQLLEMAVDNEEIHRNPMRGVTRPTVTRRELEPWSSAEVQRLRSHLPTHWQAVLDLGVGAGLRLGEILGLSIDDVEWLSKTPHIHVRRQLTKLGSKNLVFTLPKGGKTRRVRITRATRDALSAHLAAHPARNATLPWERSPGKGLDDEPAQGELLTVSLMVRGKRSGAVWPSALGKTWRTAVESAKLVQPKGQGPHMLRHLFVSVQLANGVPVTEVAQYAGHSDAGVTWRKYAHFIPSLDESETKKWRGREALNDYILGGAAEGAENTTKAQ